MKKFLFLVLSILLFAQTVWGASEFTDTFVNAILDDIVGRTAHYDPALYVGLSEATVSGETCTGVDPPDYSGYARRKISNCTSDCCNGSGANPCFNSAAASGSIANSIAIEFPVTSGTPSDNVTYFVIYDDPSAGNCLAYGSLAAPLNINASGMTPTFAVGAMTLSIE